MNNPVNKIMINGVITPDINVMDRGFQYGDGLFETMCVVDQRLPLWEKHWQRLQKGCDRLSISLPDKNKLEGEITTLIRDIAKGILKLVVTRGAGGRGYAVNEKSEPTIVLIQSDYPVHPETNWQQGIEATVCHTRLAQQPALAGIKHLNRLEQVLARNEWQDRHIAEGVMLDNKGNVIEGTMTNLFMVKNDRVFTPGLDLCGVAGVMRETVLTILAEEKIPCEITTISQEMLKTANEVFLTNSVIGLWPVKKIDDTVYPVGNTTRTIQQKLRNIISY